jgi:DNA invertase Pin-like site-specific DNA recombinase
MRCAIYARVSTVDQDCSMQLDELRRYVKARGWPKGEEYVDTGFSGTKASRPELDRLMRDARVRRVDCIVVWKLDRWGRSLGNLIGSLAELGGLGVRWIATTQNIDTDESNPTGRLLLHIMGAVAEFEREMMRERTLAGLAHARSQGRVGGRPARVFDRYHAKDLRDQGMSWRGIEKELGIAQSSIRKALAHLPVKPVRGKTHTKGGDPTPSPARRPARSRA